VRYVHDRYAKICQLGVTGLPLALPSTVVVIHLLQKANYDGVHTYNIARSNRKHILSIQASLEAPMNGVAL